ncbi:MAG: DUF4097 domain-containing protein [Vicinamibacterales bacterium]
MLDPGRTRNAVAPSILVLLAVCTGACVDIVADDGGIVERVEHRFDAGDEPVIDVQTFDGRVSVATWSRPEVLIVVEKHAADQEHADRMQVAATQEGTRIVLAVRQTGPRQIGFKSGPFSARLLVMAPPRSSLIALSGDGGIDVVDLEGDIDVRTGDGPIHVAEVSGAVSAQSGDGGIEIEGRLRNLRARSGDGGITVRAHEGSAVSDPWSIWTGDGSVMLELPSGFGAELDAHTGDGRIRVSDIAFSGPSPELAKRSLRGRIGAGGSQVRIHTGDGSISVRGVSP